MCTHKTGDDYIRIFGPITKSISINVSGENTPQNREDTEIETIFIRQTS